MMRSSLSIVFVLLVLLPACSRQEPTLLRVGAHAITIQLPEDWEHNNYGERFQLRRDMARISLDDLGRRGKDLDKAAERVLPQLGENDRRSVASRRHFLIGERDALTLDTWDTFSHQYKKRYVFINNDEGNLLAIYTMQGDLAEMEAAFDGLVASIAYADSLDLAPSADLGSGI